MGAEQLNWWDSQASFFSLLILLSLRTSIAIKVLSLSPFATGARGWVPLQQREPFSAPTPLDSVVYISCLIPA